MAIIEKFLGKRVEIPVDRRYFPKQGLWGKAEKGMIVFGLTQPFLVLAGGFNEMDWIAEEGASVESGEAVVFAITGKILYIDTPIGGNITFNPSIKRERESVGNSPYGEGWLFKIKPASESAFAMETAVDHLGYLESLKGSEGFKNPEGVVGGVSGICKAVYTGIRGQKFDK